MFGLKTDTQELMIMGLIGLGLYAQSNELNLANNTSMLLVLFMLFLEHNGNEHVRHELERIEHCGCGPCNDRRRHDHHCRPHDRCGHPECHPQNCFR